MSILSPTLMFVSEVTVADAPKKMRRKLNYWRVVINYTDNETSGNRIFSNLDKAKRWAARQEKSKVVKKCRIEPFVREPYRWRESR